MAYIKPTLWERIIEWFENNFISKKDAKKEFPMLLISGIILIAQYALTIFIIGLVFTLIVYFIKTIFF